VKSLYNLFYDVYALGFSVDMGCFYNTAPELLVINLGLGL